MKTKILAIATVALLACEGEPPKTPVGQMSGPAPASEAREEPAKEPAAATPAAVPTCCAEKTATSAPASDAGPPTSDGGTQTAAVAPAAPPAPSNGNVVGHITTTPTHIAANAVVFFEDGPVDPPAKRPPTIDNHMMNFIPFVQVVQSGNRVIFQNSDPFPHNVFSPDNGGFNIGVIAQHAAATRTFKTPGEYSLLCNLHPGMLGYVVVTPNGHFTKADSTGHYAIKDVPAGTYKVTAWAPRQKPSTQSVTVQGGDVTLDFELHR